MNKREAKKYVYTLTVRSLRRMARRITTGDIGAKARQKDVTKVRAEMEALAASLEKRVPEGRVIDSTLGHLEEKPDATLDVNA